MSELREKILIIYFLCPYKIDREEISLMLFGIIETSDDYIRYKKFREQVFDCIEKLYRNSIF